MRSILPPVLGVILSTLPVSGQGMDDPIRPDDKLIDHAQLDRMVRGQALQFHDGGLARFEQDGKYSWTYGGGGTWLGHFDVSEDSTICVTFVTGVTRCDLYVENAGRLVLITQDGTRFPIKEIR